MMNHCGSLSRRKTYKWAKYGGYHPLVWVLITGTAISRIASFMSLPFLAIYLSNNLDLDAFTVGIVLGVAGLTGSVGGFVGGYLSDRWGRHLILIVSLFVWTGAFWGFSLADTVHHLFMLNALNGLCRSVFETTSQALMSDLSTPKQRLKIFGYRYIAINVGMVIGPLLGAVLFQLMGMKVFQYTSTIYLIYFVFLCVLFRIFRSDLMNGNHSKVPFSECVRVLARDRSLGLFVLAGVLFFSAFSQLESTLPIHLKSLGKEPEFFSYLLMMNAGVVILFQHPMNRWAGKKSILTGLVIGSALCVAGFSSFAVGGTDIAFMVGMFLFTLGEVLVFPVSSLFIDRIAEERMRGVYYGANNFSQFGLFIGPFIGGWLLETFGREHLWWLMALLMLYPLLLYAMGYRIYAQSRGVTILEIIRRFLLDLGLIRVMKGMVKILPLLLTIGVFLFFLSDPWVKQALVKPSRSETVTVRIGKDASMFEIGRKLEEKGVIRNGFLFPVYAFQQSIQKGVRLQPGTYQIQAGISPEKLLQTLNRGTQKVVIREGATVQEIGQLLKHYGISEEEWNRGIYKKWDQFSFLNLLPSNRPYRLEGYLAPGTYELNKDADAEMLIDMMLQRFNNRLTGDLKEQLQRCDLRVDEWVIMASLIEEQASNGKDKREVFRRIQYSLQNDLPIGIRTLPAPYGELEEYQIWKVQGLPPGPINNPSLESLRVVLGLMKDGDSHVSSLKPKDFANQQETVNRQRENGIESHPTWRKQQKPIKTNKNTNWKNGHPSAME